MKRISILAAVAGLSLSVLGSAPPQHTLATPDDAAILARFEDLVSADLACAQLAVERGQSADVRNFAKILVSEHGMARQMARDVAAQTNLTLKPSSSSPYRAEHERILRSLRERQDAAFDVLFTRHESEYHKQLVDLINTDWIPAAKDADVKALLQQAGPAFEAHGKMADALWQRLTPR